MTNFVFAENPYIFPDFVVYQGVATADGAGDGSTVVCTDITTNADWDGNLIVITSGDYRGQARDINGSTTAGTITPASAFGGQILKNTTFSIIGIRTVPAELAAFETWVKTAIGDSAAHNLISLVAKWGDIKRSLDIILGARWDTAGDLGTDITNIIAAVSAIQNNTRFTAAVPAWMCKPDAGNEAFRVSSNLYDTEGNMEDPENNEILVRIIKDDGTYITATLYKDNAFVAVLDNATDGVTFPAASGWRAMEREAAGKFFFFNKVAHDATEESLTVEFGWTEGTKTNYQSRSTEIADVHGDLAAIKVETDKIADATYGLAAQNTYHWNKDISAYTGAKAGTYLKTLYDDWLNGGRLDLILDTINDDTKLQFATAGSKTIASSVEKYLSIDSGTDGAEIVSITIKGVIGADWTIESYIPTDDAVATPAAGDKRDEDVYVNTDDKGGQLTNIGAIPYNMFLDITNDSGISDDIDEVIVAYRSAGTLSLAWEV